MENRGRIDAMQKNWDGSKPIKFFSEIIAAKINDVNENRAYILTVREVPLIASHFYYPDLLKMTQSAGVKVIASSELDTDRQDFKMGLYPREKVRSTVTSSELHKRLESDEYLQEVYKYFVEEIEVILGTREQEYEIKGYVWKDQEMTNWDENVIEIRTEFQDFEEKEKLWQILGNKLETIQKKVAQMYCREISEDRTLFILHLSEME